MRIVVQRVSKAAVSVNSDVIAEINRGLLVYLGVAHNDTEKDAQFIAEKITGLRVFPDQQGKMNLSINDINGDVLLVSNFTLHGDCRKGRRPGFDKAAKPELANQLYEKLTELIREKGVNVQNGRFGEHMEIKSINDGPVTFILDSSKLF